MPTAIPEMKHVLVAFEFYRGPLFEGIAQYAREHHWHLSLDMLPNPGNIPWGWKGDGILTMLVRDGTPLPDFLDRCRLPTVNVEGRRMGTPYPRVLTDTGRAVALGIDHLRARGFTRFGFYGYEHSARKEVFVRRLKEAGLECAVLHESAAPWEEETRRVGAWLKDLQTPMAVFCWTDYAGARFMDMVMALGYKVPQDIAVLGMDNETLVCDCTAVRLSSIHTDLRRVGYLGAAQLDRIMAGKASTHVDLWVPPHEVVARGSTDALASDSPLVARALARMKAHHAKGAKVEDVAAICGVSRRGLEKAFRAHLGRTPHDMLVEIRMDRAKAILRDPGVKIGAVGAQVGVRDPKHFSSLFKAKEHVTPREYRRRWVDKERELVLIGARGAEDVN